MAHRSDQDRIEKTRNVPRFFVENSQVSWVLLVGVLVWGWFGYHSMPQRKDPDIPVRVAVASCSWPGATAQQVEQFVTRPIEDAVAENKTIHPGTAADYGIRSVSIPGYAYVYVQLAEDVSDVKRPSRLRGRRRITRSKVRRLLSFIRFLNLSPRTRPYWTPHDSLSCRQNKRES